MEQVYWLIPNRLCGRCGPDQVPWDLTALRAAGIGAILSVAEGLVDPTDVESADMAYACIAMSNNAPPIDGDEALCRVALPKALAFAETQMDRGHAVLVHCSAGKDRTGLFLAYYVACREGLSAEAAIAKVRHVRPVALSAEGWEPFALRLIDLMCSGR